jgi:hypothetical protein
MSYDQLRQIGLKISFFDRFFFFEPFMTAHMLLEILISGMNILAAVSQNIEKKLQNQQI